MAFDSSLISSVLERFADGAFGTIAVITFFLCEALFAALPIERARMKQLTAVLAGAGLGALLQGMPTLTDSILQGLLAGGATTIAVAKFKKPSGPVQISTVLQGSSVVGVSPVVASPVEHL